MFNLNIAKDKYDRKARQRINVIYDFFSLWGEKGILNNLMLFLYNPKRRIFENISSL